MRDLDRTQVYDLRGITEEQAKELLEWLKANDKGWEDIPFQWFMEGVPSNYYLIRRFKKYFKIFTL